MVVDSLAGVLGAYDHQLGRCTISDIRRLVRYASIPPPQFGRGPRIGPSRDFRIEACGLERRVLSEGERSPTFA